MNTKYLLLILLSVYSLISNSQIKFTEGYIVDNNNQKIDCYIRNIGNEESTMNFQYRLKEDNEVKKIELSKVQEFGIDDEMKCLRALIAIDASPSRISNLKDTLIEWDEGHAFIKVLIESDFATLYSYYDQGYPLFYYSTENVKIEPLYHKKYYLEVTPGLVERTLENNLYKEQLKKYLSCSDNIDLRKISYTKKALVKYFKNYHECKNLDYTAFKSANVNKGVFRLRLGVNSNLSQFTVEEFSDALPNIVFSQENSLGFGAEAEYNLAFNKYKWSLFAESNFYSYYSDHIKNESSPITYEDFVVDYKTIEFPVGITHYMNLGGEHRLFIRTAFVPHFILKNSYIAFSDVYHSDFTTSSRFLFGGGYNYKRLGIEFRYYTDQDITMNLYRRNSKLEQMSFRIFYDLIKTRK